MAKNKINNRFFGFVKKEVFHIIRDKRTLVILFGLPIIQILLFGFAITNEIKNANIAILDLSKDEVSEKLTNKILSSGYFQLYSNLHSFNEIEKVFQSGKVKQVIVFEENFGENLYKSGKANLQLISDASEPNTGNALISYTSNIVQNFQQSINLQNQAPMQIITELKMNYNPELRGAYMFVPGLVAIILIMVSAMLTSISITREKELGTMEILLASPMKPIIIIIGKVMPYMLLSFINANIIILLGKYIFGVPIVGSYIFLMIESLLYILVALSLGIFISTVTQTQQAALMISLMGLMLPTIMLSGYVFPVENMPLPLQIISNIIPAKWFIIIVRSVMLKGSNILDLWKENLVLIGFVLFFVLLSLKKYKVRLE